MIVLAQSLCTHTLKYMDAQNLKRGHVTLNLPMSELIYRQSASAYHKQFVYQICSTQLHYCKNKKGSNI